MRRPQFCRYGRWSVKAHTAQRRMPYQPGGMRADYPRPISFSKARSSSVVQNVPPMYHDVLAQRIRRSTPDDLIQRIFTTLMESPAKYFSTKRRPFVPADGLFINTVHRVPRSTGFLPKSPSSKFLHGIAHYLRKVCKNEPQPEEQASFKNKLSMVPLWILKHLISWPPTSMIKSTFG